MNNNNFYIYVYLNPLIKGEFIYDEYKFEYEPFYVGKGKNRRYKEHLYEQYLKKENTKNNIIKEILSNNQNPIIIKLHENLTELESFKLERLIIKKIGNIIYNNGPLTNLTVGGEGACSTIISEETRKKCSDAGKRNGRKGKTNVEYFGLEKADELKKKNGLDKIGKTYEDLYGEERANYIKKKQSKSNIGKHQISDEGKARLREYGKNRIVSDETKEKITKSLYGHKRNLGKHHTKETIDKISKSKIGSIPYNKYVILQYDLDMNFIKEWDSSTLAGKELHISQGNINSVVIGKRKSASGFIWKKK